MDVSFGCVLIGIILLVTICYTAVCVIVYASQAGKHGQEQRGFEVKQNTGGESPVLREKENDHG